MRPKLFGMQQDSPWQTDDALAGRRFRIVGVEVKKRHWEEKKGSRHRVVSVSAPRMTTQQAANGEIQPAKRAVFAQCLDCILRASGLKATRGRQKRREEKLIEANGENEQSRQPLQKKRHGENQLVGGVEELAKRSAVRWSKSNRRLWMKVLFSGLSESQMNAMCSATSAGRRAMKSFFCKR